MTIEILFKDVLYSILGPDLVGLTVAVLLLDQDIERNVLSAIHCMLILRNGVTMQQFDMSWTQFEHP